MLVIRRRLGESILIGENVEVQIVDLSSSRVKLGISAPRQVSILRKEVRLTQEENRAASRGFSLERFSELALGLRRGSSLS
jgi:carbon storage regulator